MATRLGTATSNTGNTSLDFTQEAGANRRVTGIFSEEYSGQPTVTATFGGVAMTLVVVIERFGGGGAIWVFVLDEADLPADGVRAFVVSPTGGTGEGGRALFCASVQDADQAAPENYIGTAGATTVSPSAPVEWGDTSVIFAACHSNAGTAFTQPTGYTEHVDVDLGGGDYRFGVSSIEQTSSGSETPVYEDSSATAKAVVFVVFENVSAPASATTPLLGLTMLTLTTIRSTTLAPLTLR